MPGVCGGLTDILLGLPVCIVCGCSGLHRVGARVALRGVWPWDRLFIGSTIAESCKVAKVEASLFSHAYTCARGMNAS